MTKEFLQNWLDDVADAFFAEDFDAYANAVKLPLMVKTDGGTMIVETEESLREGFDAWVKMMKAQKVTHMIRTVKEAAWLTDGVISGLYETDVLSDANRVLPKFISLMELHNVDGHWRASTVVNGMKNIQWPITSPIVVPDEVDDPRVDEQEQRTAGQRPSQDN